MEKTVYRGPEKGLYAENEFVKYMNAFHGATPIGNGRTDLAYVTEYKLSNHNVTVKHRNIDGLMGSRAKVIVIGDEPDVSAMENIILNAGKIFNDITSGL